jgi:hypothetical protein
MKWKKRKAEIERLRARYARSPYREPFPDLSTTKSGVAPLGNSLNQYRTEAPQPKPKTALIVDHFHKSGLQVILPSELPWAGGKKP